MRFRAWDVTKNSGGLRAKSLGLGGHQGFGAPQGGFPGCDRQLRMVRVQGCWLKRSPEALFGV